MGCTGNFFFDYRGYDSLQVFIKQTIPRNHHGIGAGTLISAVSYELVYEAVKLARGTGFPGLGLFAGAFTFFFTDKLIDKFGARNHTKIEAPKQASLVVPMVLAIILDGVPESIVIGLSIFEGGTVSMAMLVAVFISNLPEPWQGLQE